MPISFSNLRVRRRIVIHHTHVTGGRPILECLKPNDIVFFDDCLYSQYAFLKCNASFFAENGIDCVLGFSAGLYAPESAKQICNVESKALHDACNAKIKNIETADALRGCLPEMAGFMKVSQVKELLEYPFCKLALHGCCHLKLENMDGGFLVKTRAFIDDLKAGMARFNELGLRSDMYVYPYVYPLAISDTVLRKCGFKTIVGSDVLRIPIESLAFGLDVKCDC